MKSNTNDKSQHNNNITKLQDRKIIEIAKKNIDMVKRQRLKQSDTELLDFKEYIPDWLLHKYKKE